MDERLVVRITERQRRSNYRTRVTSPGIANARRIGEGEIPGEAEF